MAQQLQAGGIHPVQVVEDHDQGRLGGGQGKEAGNAFEDQESLGVGVGAGTWRVHREPTCQAGHQAGQGGAVGLDELPQKHLICLVDQLREGGDPRLVGDAEVLFAVAIEDVGPRSRGRRGPPGPPVWFCRSPAPRRSGRP